MSSWPRILAILVVLALAGAVVPASVHAQLAAAEPSGTARVAAAAKAAVVGLLVTTPSKDPRRPGDEHAAGTGFIFRDGYLMTNAHVVADATEVRVLFNDRTVTVIQEIKSQVWWDETTDVGVIKVDTGGEPPLPLGDSDGVQIGEQVVAIGNPLGFRLGNTVTAGILSGRGRAVGSGVPFLQMDAPINPGNSGGPLLNIRGEVVGINSASIPGIGIEGLHFAIPIKLALAVAADLAAHGKVDRPWLGLTLEEDWKAYFGVPGEAGVQIAQIIPDSPAGHTPLKIGDKVIGIDDRRVETEDDIHSYLLGKRPGEVITLRVRRGGQELEATVTLEPRLAIREEAVGQRQEATGMLFLMTPSQVRDAAEFGRNLTRGGWGRLLEEYTARSGPHTAVLYTEFTYVVRRVLSAFAATALRPSQEFEGAVAANIRGFLEVELQMQATGGGFLSGARAELRQGEWAVPGTVYQPPNYLRAIQGDTALGKAVFRFPSQNLDARRDLNVVVELADGSQYTFHFTVRDLK